MREENDIPLCRHMSLAKANLQLAYQMWPTGNLRAMADRLADAQAELREAESRINQIIFANEASSSSQNG